MASLYRRQHSKLQLSPLLEDDTPLLDFYVMPDILSVKAQRGRGSVKEEKTLVTPFSNVFFKENKTCNEIYLTADAGLGKTACSKRLALAWCHAKKPLPNESQYFSQEEIEVISRFRFVFLLLLRECSSECDIDDLILAQIISQIPHTSYTLNDLKNILAKEKCLVILDGLDEWSHPSNSCDRVSSSIPHRQARECTVVLTTSRPWKLSLSHLTSSQIDQKLEITGLNPESANMLKTSVFSHLFKEKDKNQLNTYVTEFTRAVEDKHISDLQYIPLLLTYLLFMWYYKIELGQSHCDLYSNIVELLLSRTKKPNEKPSIGEHAQGDVLRSFSKLENCRRFYPRLICLGHLAFHTLFTETREENMLVFDSSVAEKYLDEQCLIFFLRTGIITQSKVPGTLLEQISKVSFAHKTVQEFFAALYIHSTSDQTSVLEILLSKCKSVRDILEMSKILIFLSGSNVNVSSSISRELMTVINEDEISHIYRSSLEESKPLKQFQDMCVSCCKELPHENEVNFCLQDVFIDESCQREQYHENLKQLTARNKQNIRSLYIFSYDTPYISAQEVIEYFALSDLENIEKIVYEGEYNDLDILPLLKRSVKCLLLMCRYCFLSDLLCEKVITLQKLEAISIGMFVMSKEQLILLYDYISQRHCMREIMLAYLSCTDHEDTCTGCSLDLSKHSQLRKILLKDIPVSDLNINMSSLEECELRELSNQDLVLRFTNCVPAEGKVDSFVCADLKSFAAVDTIQQTLPSMLVHVKHIDLSLINLGNRELLSPEMVNIKSVFLSLLTMPAVVLRGIVTVLQKLPQAITVDIDQCIITPGSEFDAVKDEIKQSAQFRVIWNSDASVDSDDMFAKDLTFETIKDGK